MSGKYSTTVIVSFCTGLLGGMVPGIFSTDRVTFAQSPQDVLQKYKEIPIPATKVIRAERIELVNNRGKALVVFAVRYSEAQPAGAPMMTFTDRDEVFHKDRKVVLTNSQFSMDNGQEEWSRLVPGGGLTFRDGEGGGGFGKITLSVQPLTVGHGVQVYDPSGVMTLTGQRLYIGDKAGHPIVILPQ
jgi:hypothetical protein